MDIETRLALEAFKPATGIINAILAPKIDKVKEWAEERDLKGKLEPSSLSKTFESYLTKLSKRVSEITSITFPLQKLNISEAYEPLYLELIRDAIKCERHTVEDLLHSNRNAALIIDSAGMGKSTFSKYFVSQVLFKSDRIPLFFELRKLNKGQELIEELAKELDALGKQFSRELFYELLKLGKFIVILDGFDEVDLDFQNDLLIQINDLSLKGGENKLLLTSRPQELLPDLVDSATYRFGNFTIEQASSLVLRYDSISKLDIGSRLIRELNSVPEKFIETPLLVSLLYRTFGTNNSIADRVCTFYDEIYHALYKGHDLMNKNGYIRQKKSELDFENFRRLLRALCYYMAVNRKTSFESWSETISYITKATQMSSVEPSSPHNFLDDLLVAVPLMQRDGSEFKFLHKTILEFFAAEYIIFRTDSLELGKRIFESRLFPSFNKVFDFIFDISPTLYERIVTLHHANNLLVLADTTNNNILLLKSLAYLKDSIFGFWEVEKYSIARTVKNGSISRKVFMNPTPNEQFEEGYLSTSSINVIIDGVQYHLAFMSKDSTSKMHNCAWKQISESISIENLCLNNDFSFAQDTAKNTWHKLLSSNIIKAASYEPFLNLAARVLVGRRYSLESDELRVFSPSQAKLFI
ncbi:NACHT domain-containing protein, partial [Vibrio cholerae]